MVESNTAAKVAGGGLILAGLGVGGYFLYESLSKKKNPVGYTLRTSVTPAGSGTITINPSPDATTGKYASGVKVTLTASPASGYSVASWVGADAASTTATATVTMAADKTVVCTFIGSTPTPGNNGVTLGYSADPPEAGKVTVTPSPNASGGKYSPGTLVTFTVTGNYGNYTWVGWEDELGNPVHTGVSTAVDNPLVDYSVTTNKVIRAKFSGTGGVVKSGVKLSLASDAIATFSPSTVGPDATDINYSFQIMADGVPTKKVYAGFVLAYSARGLSSFNTDPVPISNWYVQEVTGITTANIPVTVAFKKTFAPNADYYNSNGKLSVLKYVGYASAPVQGNGKVTWDATDGATNVDGDVCSFTLGVTPPIDVYVPPVAQCSGLMVTVPNPATDGSQCTLAFTITNQSKFATKWVTTSTIVQNGAVVASTSDTIAAWGSHQYSLTFPTPLLDNFQIRLEGTAPDSEIGGVYPTISPIYSPTYQVYWTVPGLMTTSVQNVVATPNPLRASNNVAVTYSVINVSSHDGLLSSECYLVSGANIYGGHADGPTNLLAGATGKYAIVIPVGSSLAGKSVTLRAQANVYNASTGSFVRDSVHEVIVYVAQTGGGL